MFRLSVLLPVDSARIFWRAIMTSILRPEFPNSAAAPTSREPKCGGQAPVGERDNPAGADNPRSIMEQYVRVFEELFGGGFSPQEMWRMQQEAMKAASVTEDFPLSQGSKADQWKE
jgi:hypothetical protein